MSNEPPPSQLSAQAYQQGLVYLAKARAAHFQDKGLIEQAIDSFYSAIRHDRQNTDPYIAMAYLFVLLGDRSQALSFTQRALQLDPNLEAAQDLLQGFQEIDDLKEQEPDYLLKALQRSGTPVSDDDYDQRYEEVEQVLQAQLRFQLSKGPPPAIVMEAEVLQQLRQRQADLKAVSELLTQQIILLSAEFEIAELKQKQQPLLQLEQNYARAISAIESVQAIRQQIVSAHAFGKHCLQAFKENRVVANHSLESLYDQCDLIADQLEQLEQAHLPLSLAMQEYEQLIKTVQSLQNELDEEN